MIMQVYSSLGNLTPAEFETLHFAGSV